jgi:hypothetical protein
MKKKFIQFLKDNDALIPYITNVAHFNKGMTLSQAISLVKETSAQGLKALIKETKLFWWSDTTEGFFYWDELDDKWQATFD